MTIVAIATDDTGLWFKQRQEENTKGIAAL
jgi:hypothetical protein